MYVKIYGHGFFFVSIYRTVARYELKRVMDGERPASDLWYLKSKL